MRESTKKILEEIEDEEAPPDIGDLDDENESLTSNELVFLANMIDLLAKRGAFHPSEFIDIGLVYNKIKYLQQQKPCKNC